MSHRTSLWSVLRLLGVLVQSYDVLFFDSFFNTRWDIQRYKTITTTTKIQIRIIPRLKTHLLTTIFTTTTIISTTGLRASTCCIFRVVVLPSGQSGVCALCVAPWPKMCSKPSHFCPPTAKSWCSWTNTLWQHCWIVIDQIVSRNGRLPEIFTLANCRRCRHTTERNWRIGSSFSATCLS